MIQQERADIGTPEGLGALGGAEVHWRIALPVLVAGIVGLTWIHWDTAVSMYDLWSRNHAYNHALLVLPVCLYLAWERRHFVRRLQPQPSLLGPLLVFGFGTLWLVSDAVDVTAGRQVALIGMIEGLVLATLGWRVCRALLFPLLYAWLVVPVDFGLLPPLQQIATVASSWGIGMLGIPMFVEDVFIEVPTGRYWVAPGCAGLNFLLSGFALSLLYGEQMYDGWRKRALCVAIMIVVAIVANWIRIFGLIVAGHYFNEIYDINDHYTEGWLFFAVIVFAMMWIGLRFRDPERALESDEHPPRAPAMRPAAPGAVTFYFAVALLTAAGGAAYPAYAAFRKSDMPPPPTVHIVFPDEIGGWRLGERPSDWRPTFNGADVQDTRRYTRGEEHVDLYLAYYEWQGNGREVVAYGNRVYDRKKWRKQRNAVTKTQIGRVPVNVAVENLRSNRVQRVVWHTYWIDGRFTSSPMVAKLLQAKADLLFGDRRAGFIAVSVEQAKDKAALNAFLNALSPIPAFIVPVARGG